MKNSIIAIAIASLVSGSAFAYGLGFEGSQAASISGAASSNLETSASNHGTGASHSVVTGWSGSASDASVSLTVSAPNCYNRDYSAAGTISGATNSWAGGTVDKTGNAHGEVNGSAWSKAAANYDFDLGNRRHLVADLDQSGKASSKASIEVDHNGSAYAQTWNGFEGHGNVAQVTTFSEGVKTTTVSGAVINSGIIGDSGTIVVGHGNEAKTSGKVSISGDYSAGFAGPAGFAGHGSND